MMTTITKEETLKDLEEITKAIKSLIQFNEGDYSGLTVHLGVGKDRMGILLAAGAKMDKHTYPNGTVIEGCSITVNQVVFQAQDDIRDATDEEIINAAREKKGV
jgi:hypothetical protein